jgi:hypothetical protein
MALFTRYNNENILIRSVVAGLLDILNNHIKYNQVWGNDPIEDIETISVPWFYNQSGDERFMQDFYTHFAHCMPPRPADGNFDMIPRGIITYTGSNIDSARITSRYIQGRYVKEIDGKLEGFVSFLYSIPLKVSIDCELWTDTQTTAFKIEQELRETFYRNVTYYIYYKGMRVGCTVGFPEQYAIEKNINYSFEQQNKIKLTFQLEIETYQPVFDKTTEMKASNVMKKGLTYSLYDRIRNDGKIEIRSPLNNSIIPKGIPIWIEWSFTQESGIMRNIDVYWLYSGQNNRNEIELVQPNHEYYIWTIPEDFTTYNEPTVIWEETNNITISRKPLLKIIPDLLTGEITSSSFRAFSEGYFLTASEDASIAIQLEITDSNGQITYSPDGAIWANIRYNKLDLLDPVTVSSDVSVYYPDIIEYKEIDLHIANSINTDIFGIVNNLKII